MTPTLRGVPGSRVRLAVCLLYAAVLAAFLLTRGTPLFYEVVIPFGFLSGNLIALGFGIRSALHRGLDRQTRRAWWCIAAGSLALILSIIGYAATGAANSTAIHPSIGDLAHALFPPAMLAGLLTFPVQRRSRREAVKNALDVVTVVAGGFMILWYLVLGPTIASGDLSPLQTATALGYPLGDLALLFGAIMVLVRGTRSSGRPLVLLILAMTALIAGDTYLGYLKSHPGSGTPVWQLACWLTAWYLMALAAVEQWREAGQRRDSGVEQQPLRPVSRLPYLATGVGYAVLFFAAWRAGLYPWAGLVAGGAVVTAAVAARQLVMLRENNDLIVTDHLTGLSNRAHLHQELGRSLDRAARQGSAVTVLQLDMNGFKQINDTYGHEAGDAVLVAFAGILRASVLGADLAARLGGDEFVIVLGGDGSAGAAVARRIITALDAPVQVGERHLPMGASIGIATFTGGEVTGETAAGLLHAADTAMYAAKRHKPASVYRQAAPLERRTRVG